MNFNVIWPPCALNTVLHHETFFQVGLYLNMLAINLLVSRSPEVRSSLSWTELSFHLHFSEGRFPACRHTYRVPSNPDVYPLFTVCEHTCSQAVPLPITTSLSGDPSFQESILKLSCWWKKPGWELIRWLGGQGHLPHKPGEQVPSLGPAQREKRRTHYTKLSSFHHVCDWH